MSTDTTPQDPTPGPDFAAETGVIRRWVRYGGVSTETLAAELLKWATYFDPELVELATIGRAVQRAEVVVDPPFSGYFDPAAYVKLDGKEYDDDAVALLDALRGSVLSVAPEEPR